MPLNALIVRGPFRGPSGYAHHVREFVRELHNQGVAVELIDLPELNVAELPSHLRDPWFDSLDKPSGARTALHFCMPHQVARQRGKINVNYTMFEATRIPRLWVRRNRRHDLVVVPTDSSAQAWIGSGMPEGQVRICPLGINPALFSGSATPMEIHLDSGESIQQYRTRFLNVSALDSRKNLIGLLRAWIAATGSGDDAALIIKLGCYAPGRLGLFQWRLRTLETQLGKTLREAAPVHFIYDLLADASMPRLYAAATHYISLSFGEGWDLPMAEAAASGLRLITPRHSAYPAYLDSSVATLITSREVPVVCWGDPLTAKFFEHAAWWEPDQEEAVAAIRSAIDGRDQPVASARERMLREFTWEQATRRLIAILSELEARKERRWFFLWPRLNRSGAAKSRRSRPDDPGVPGRS